MILFPLSHPYFVVKRVLPVFGYDEPPHGHTEVVFDNVRVPWTNILLGEGAASRSSRAASGWDAHPALHAADRAR
jgi:alkylation response protein AidB-like acyl-CoA dehydrogenase